MNNLHEMVPEDEIILCGVVLLLGLVLGAATRLVVAMIRQRRAS